MIGYVSRKKVFSAPYFDVFEETLQTENKSYSHINAYRKPIVCLFPLTPQNELYLIEEVRPMLGRIVLGCIAGHANEGENIEVAAHRELKEETGISAKQLIKLRDLDASASIFDSKASLYLARDFVVGDATPDEDENIKLVKMPLTEAIEKVFDGTITTQTTIIGILLLERMMFGKGLSA